MMYYDVYVVDRYTEAEVCVGCLLSRSEASMLLKTFQEFDVDAYLISYMYKNGRRIEV